MYLLSLLLVLWSAAGESTADPQNAKPKSLSVDVVWQNLVTKPSSSSLLRRVPEWSVEDAAFWMNFSVGYPEYTPHILKHRVDGPTLLSLSAEDFDLYFPIEHGLHLIKIRAHLDILKGKCLCPNSERSDLETDFWTLLRRENTRMWMLGGSSLQFPRLVMLVAYFFDYENTVVALMQGSENVDDDNQGVFKVTDEEVERAEAAVRSGTPSSPPKSLTLGQEVTFWLSFVLVPDVFMAYQCGRLFLTNYFVIFFFIFHFLLQTYNELIVVYSLYKGEQIFDRPGMNLVQKFWFLHSWFTFVPVLFVISGFIAPLFLQQLVVWALCGHATVVLAGIMVHAFVGAPQAAPPQETDKKES